MKTKIFLLGIIVAATCMVSCNHDDVSFDQEKSIIKAVYQSLDLTPEQFGENMAKLGLQELQQSEAMIDNYKTFANEVVVRIHFQNDTILQVTYERTLTDKPNIAAYYRLFSDMLADHGYTEWHGYYEDPDEDHNYGRLVHGGNDYSYAQEAEDREDLCTRINNENLSDVNSTQYFAENFIHNHSDNSQWEGKTLLWSSTYFSQTWPGKWYKDVSFTFWLDRIH